MRLGLREITPPTLKVSSASTIFGLAVLGMSITTVRALGALSDLAVMFATSVSRKLDGVLSAMMRVRV